MLSKEPGFLTKTTGIFFYPKIVIFFICIKNWDPFYIQKKSSAFFALKKWESFFNGIFFYILRKFCFFRTNNTKNRASVFSKNIPDFFQPQKGFSFCLLTTCSVQCVILKQVRVGGRLVRNTKLRTIAYYFEKKIMQNRHKKGK